MYLWWDETDWWLAVILYNDMHAVHASRRVKVHMYSCMVHTWCLVLPILHAMHCIQRVWGCGAMAFEVLSSHKTFKVYRETFEGEKVSKILWLGGYKWNFSLRKHGGVAWQLQGPRVRGVVVHFHACWRRGGGQWLLRRLMALHQNAKNTGQ